MRLSRGVNAKCVADQTAASMTAEEGVSLHLDLEVRGRRAESDGGAESDCGGAESDCGGAESDMAARKVFC